MTQRRLIPLLLAACLATGSAFAQLKMPGQSAPSGQLGSPSIAAPAPSPSPASPPSAATPAKPGAASPDTTQLRDAAQLAAQGWLLLLDRRDWGTAWDASASMFRSSVPLATWMDGIPKARAPLGKFIERKPLDAVYKNELPGRPKGDYVTVVFAAKFENKADSQEIVTTVREPDGKWRVTGYSTK